MSPDGITSDSTGPYHDPRWHHQLLSSGYSSLPLSLQFCLFIVPTSLCFSYISHHLLPLVATGVSDYLGLSQESCVALLNYGARPRS